MSIIVWDGKSLAADRIAVNADMRFTGNKILVTLASGDKTACAWVGNNALGLALVNWYADGADKNRWPEFQKDKEDWCRLIIADKTGCRYYEDRPYVTIVEDDFMAWGSGRDFAMGALAMGADARKAVEIASRFSIYCGVGIDAVDLR